MMTQHQHRQVQKHLLIQAQAAQPWPPLHISHEHQWIRLKLCQDHEAHHILVNIVQYTIIVLLQVLKRQQEKVHQISSLSLKY